MDNETHSNTTDLANDRAAHRTAIKKRLIQAIEKSGFTAYQLHALLNKSNAQSNKVSHVFDYGMHRCRNAISFYPWLSSLTSHFLKLSV